MLALLLLALVGGVQVWGAGTEGIGRGLLRQAVALGLPIASGLVALAVFRRPPPSDEARLAPGAWRRLAPWLAAALALDLAALPLGYALGWLTLTYGDQELEARKVYTWIWALPLAILLSTFATEWALRGRLWRACAAAGAERLGWVLACLCGLALATPVFAPGFAIADGGFVAAALAVAAAHELGFTLLYRRAGLFAAGVARGGLLYFDAFLLADWYSLYFPAANYVSSEPRFYVLRGLLAWVALAALARGLGSAPVPAATVPAATPSGVSGA